MATRDRVGYLASVIGSFDKPQGRPRVLYLRASVGVFADGYFMLTAYVIRD